MKKLVTLLLLLSTTSYAYTCKVAPNDAPKQPDCSNESTKVCHGNSIVQAGGSYSYVWITPHGNPTFRGSLGGMQASYEYKPNNSIYEAALFSWRQGSTDQADNTRFLLDFDAHERLGYTFAGRCNRWTASLFSGLGYRYLSQKLEQPALADLKFNYNELYIPVGFLVDGKVASCCSFGVNFTWMPQVYPALTIKPLGGANWILSRTLKNFLAEFPITFLSPCKCFTIEFKPFFEYWQDGKTNAVSEFGFALDVPGNNYIFCGADLNLGWKF